MPTLRPTKIAAGAGPGTDSLWPGPLRFSFQSVQKTYRVPRPLYDAAMDVAEKREESLVTLTEPRPLTTTDGTVGLVHVNCPCCGAAVEVDVRIATLEFTGGSYFRVTYQPESPSHACPGRRT